MIKPTQCEQDLQCVFIFMITYKSPFISRHIFVEEANTDLFFIFVSALNNWKVF